MRYGGAAPAQAEEVVQAMALEPLIHVNDLAQHLEIPSQGTLSLTLYQDAWIKVVLFGFAAGQELSEHTASVPAILHQIRGQARWRLGDRPVAAGPGTWVHMPAHLPHAIAADTPSVMLLTLVLSAKTAEATP